MKLISTALVYTLLAGGVFGQQPKGWSQRPATVGALQDQPKIEIVKIRIEPFRNPEGRLFQMLYVDWKNTGQVAIGDVRAELSFYAADGQLLDHVTSYCIFTTCDENKTIKPGKVYSEPKGEGFVVMTKQMQGQSTARAEVRVVRLKGYNPC